MNCVLKKMLVLIVAAEQKNATVPANLHVAIRITRSSVLCFLPPHPVRFRWR